MKTKIREGGHEADPSAEDAHIERVRAKTQKDWDDVNFSLRNSVARSDAYQLDLPRRQVELDIERRVQDRLLGIYGPLAKVRKKATA